MKKAFSKVVLFVLTLVLCMSFSGCNFFKDYDPFVPEFPNSIASASDFEFNVNEETHRVADRVSAVAKVERSVVAIMMTYQTASNTTGKSFGSGVILDNHDANDNVFYVLTCHHVIDSKGTATIYIPDERCRNYTDEDYNDNYAFSGNIESNNSRVQLVGGDKLADIAVLKLDVSNSKITKNDIVCSVLPPDDYQMRRGESVFAIGNPSGEMPMTVSNGIISYIDREINVNDLGKMFVTQIDVQINHGNSGGGLFNYYGELIGITNAGSEEFDGMNYSIPYKLTYVDEDASDNFFFGFVKAASQLISTYYQVFNQTNYGYISGSWELGIMVTNNSKTDTRQRITSVAEGSNADLSGLRVGDIIESVEYGTQQWDISTNDDLRVIMSTLRSNVRLGDTITIVIVRGGVRMGCSLQLTKQFIFCDTGNPPVESEVA